MGSSNHKKLKDHPTKALHKNPNNKNSSQNMMHICIIINLQLYVFRESKQIILTKKKVSASSTLAK